MGDADGVIVGDADGAKLGLEDGANDGECVGAFVLSQHSNQICLPVAVETPGQHAPDVKPAARHRGCAPQCSGSATVGITVGLVLGLALGDVVGR